MKAEKPLPVSPDAALPRPWEDRAEQPDRRARFAESLRSVEEELNVLAPRLPGSLPRPV
jgi:hypothetical protein